MANYFITGTDTGVGKTVVSLLMMQFFFEKGYTPFYFKPFQTGCKDPYDTDSDAAFVYRHVSHLQSRDPADSVGVCFKNPKAPYFAAKDQDAQIDMAQIFNKYKTACQNHSPVIVEGAGGLLVPVTHDTMIVDVIKRLAIKPILVARAGLGTINHTLLSIEALRQRKIEPVGIVLVDNAQPPVPEYMVAENQQAIENVSGISILGKVGKINDFGSLLSSNSLIFEALV